VNQGNIGDCFLVAALAAIVSSDPQFIYTMMKDDGKGKVTVRLFQPSANGAMTPKYFTIQKSLVTGNRRSSGALWVPLLEKAYATMGLDREGKPGQDKAYVVDASKSYAKLGDGGFSDTSFEILTGHRTARKTSGKNLFPMWGPAEQELPVQKTQAYAALQDDDLTKQWFAFAKIHAKALDVLDTSIPQTPLEGFEKFFQDNRLAPEIGGPIAALLSRNKPALRGRGLYTDGALAKFDLVHDALEKKQHVAAMTRETIETETGGKKGKGHSGGEDTAEGLVGSHVYTILAARDIPVGAKTRKFVRMRNPWGKGGSLSGTGRVYKGGLTGNLEIETDLKRLTKLAKPEFDLELTDFEKHFTQVFIS
jgi:Calpain family cysteine protease